MVEANEVKIQKDIDRLLLHHSKDRDTFVRRLSQLEKSYGSGLYPSLLYTTAHLEFGTRSARVHWREILKLWEWMGRKVRPDVDLRLAILDYFIETNKRIKNPKIIELRIFYKTLQETIIDELTHLYNYRYFIHRLDQEIDRAKRYRTQLSLVMFDIDDFKHYNDTNGHLTGSQVLKSLAQVLHKTARDTDILCRYGGEEFALILPESTKDGAFVIADRIRKRVERKKFPHGEKQPLRRVTISGGVATLGVDAATKAGLIKKADQALYRAKSLGKNQVAPCEENRRDFGRMKLSIPEAVALTEVNGDRYQVRDLSREGIMFLYSRTVPLGTTLRFQLTIPDRTAPIPCHVKVKRLEELRKDRTYGIGGKFVRMKEQDSRALRRFLPTLAALR